MNGKAKAARRWAAFRRGVENQSMRFLSMLYAFTTSPFRGSPGGRWLTLWKSIRSSRNGGGAQSPLLSSVRDVGVSAENQKSIESLKNRLRRSDSGNSLPISRGDTGTLKRLAKSANSFVNGLALKYVL